MALGVLRCDRLARRSRGRTQAVDLAQALALRRQRALLVLVGTEGLDLLDLERQQVQVAVTRARAVVQLGELALRGADVRVGLGHPAAQRHVLLAAEAIEQLQLCRGHREFAVLVLPEEGDQP